MGSEKLLFCKCTFVHHELFRDDDLRITLGSSSVTYLYVGFQVYSRTCDGLDLFHTSQSCCLLLNRMIFFSGRGPELPHPRFPGVSDLWATLFTLLHFLHHRRPRLLWNPSQNCWKSQAYSQITYSGMTWMWLEFHFDFQAFVFAVQFWTLTFFFFFNFLTYLFLISTSITSLEIPLLHVSNHRSIPMWIHVGLCNHNNLSFNSTRWWRSNI